MFLHATINLFLKKTISSLIHLCVLFARAKPFLHRKVKKNLAASQKNPKSEDTDYISFCIKASEVFGFLSLGNLDITVTCAAIQKCEFAVKFVTCRKIFFVIALILALTILAGVFVTRDLKLIIALPFLFASGHILFWGMIPSKTKRLKQYLFSLDE